MHGRQSVKQTSMSAPNGSQSFQLWPDWLQPPYCYDQKTQLQGYLAQT
jgi:hypothetical protein